MTCAKFGRTVVPGSIYHLAERGIFIPLSAWLDHKISESSVKDRIGCIDVDLIESASGFTIWLKESIRIIWISVNIYSRAVAGYELIFTVIQFLFQLGIKHIKKSCQCLIVQFTALFVESRF